LLGLKVKSKYGGVIIGLVSVLAILIGVNIWLYYNSIPVTNNTKAFNVTLSDWTARWWKWAFSFSGYYNNPLLDPNGTSVMKFQPLNQPVFFLSGAYNSVGNRTVTIPADKGILFPVLNGEISFLDLPNATNQADLKKALDSDIGTATYIGAELDGKEIQFQRIQAPLFDINYAKDNILSTNNSGPTQAVSDGYWIYLGPNSIPVGEHILHIKGEQPFYRSEVTYKVNIQAESNGTTMLTELKK
jgi:hypothetical protein